MSRRFLRGRMQLSPADLFNRYNTGFSDNSQPPFFHSFDIESASHYAIAKYLLIARSAACQPFLAITPSLLH